MKILFYDGSLDVAEIDNAHYEASALARDAKLNIIDARFGPTKNEECLGLLEYKAVVLTNSIVALDHKYGWNDDDNCTDIYIWQADKKEFMRIDRLTLREIHYAHSINKMYMNGEFRL